ncbi:MAG: helix-hairpin-helix domain-containing protein [Sandaracinaceae bacterium]|nr:helix-hairpin-helix domain-containing protein [Sandaracinaceae bacterium]
MADDLILLSRALAPLGLLDAAPPWDLGHARPPMPIVIDPILIPPAPMPYDLDPALVLGCFSPADRPSVAARIDDAYDEVRYEERAAPPGDPETFIRVALGTPLLGTDRALIRIRTSNLFRDARDRAQLVTGDFHAFVDLEGSPIALDVPPELETAWPRWVVGRSPGLRARLDLNRADEHALRCLPAKLGVKQARAILDARPFASIEQLRDVAGIGERTFAALRDHVTVG